MLLLNCSSISSDNVARPTHSSSTNVLQYGLPMGSYGHTAAMSSMDRPTPYPLVLSPRSLRVQKGNSDWNELTQWMIDAGYKSKGKAARWAAMANAKGLPLHYPKGCSCHGKGCPCNEIPDDLPDDLPDVDNLPDDLRDVLGANSNDVQGVLIDNAVNELPCPNAHLYSMPHTPPEDPPHLMVPGAPMTPPMAKVNGAVAEARALQREWAMVPKSMAWDKGKGKGNGKGPALMLGKGDGKSFASPYEEFGLCMDSPDEERAF
jgi:hypothetical protein